MDTILNNYFLKSWNQFPTENLSVVILQRILLGFSEKRELDKDYFL